MKVLVACEYSGIVRECFSNMGHYAVSCDFIESERNGNHYLGDVRDIINDGWDIMIAHPPCTYLCSSGLHWNKRRPERSQLTEEALGFVSFLLESNIPKICLENPIGCISSRIRKPDQIIQPFYFGHPESKATCLWLKNLPLLNPTNILEKPKSGIWENQTKSGQNKLPPSKDRWKIRSRTYEGIAKAMSEQWGKIK